VIGRRRGLLEHQHSQRYQRIAELYVCRIEAMNPHECDLIGQIASGMIQSEPGRPVCVQVYL